MAEFRSYIQKMPGFHRTWRTTTQAREQRPSAARHSHLPAHSCHRRADPLAAAVRSPPQAAAAPLHLPWHTTSARKPWRCSLLRTARHGTARHIDARAAPQQPPPSGGGTRRGSGHGRAPAATEPCSRAVLAGPRTGRGVMVGGGVEEGNRGCRGPSVQSPLPPPASPRIRAAPCPLYRGGAGETRARLGHGARCRCGRGATGGGAEQRTLPSLAASPSSSCRAGGARAGRPSSLHQRGSGLRCVVNAWGREGEVSTLSNFQVELLTFSPLEGLFSQSLGKACGFPQSWA